MKKLFARMQRTPNMNTAIARSRMVRSMPGEAAALASFRLGGMSL